MQVQEQTPGATRGCSRCRSEQLCVHMSLVMPVHPFIHPLSTFLSTLSSLHLSNSSSSFLHQYRSHLFIHQSTYLISPSFILAYLYYIFSFSCTPICFSAQPASMQFSHFKSKLFLYISASNAYRYAPTHISTSISDNNCWLFRSFYIKMYTNVHVLSTTHINCGPNIQIDSLHVELTK